jgi:hypothetical protein
MMKSNSGLKNIFALPLILGILSGIKSKLRITFDVM